MHNQAMLTMTSDRIDIFPFYLPDLTSILKVVQFIVIANNNYIHIIQDEILKIMRYNSRGGIDVWLLTFLAEVFY